MEEESIQLKCKINDYASRSFRDPADQDYIVARMAYSGRLILPFLWLSHQAIEKYLKCILLINRIPVTSATHDLGKLLRKIQTINFIEFEGKAIEFVERINKIGNNRYFNLSYHILSDYIDIELLNSSVYNIRCYCRPLDYDVTLPSGENRNMIEPEIANIKNGCGSYIYGGFIENVLSNQGHPSRNFLLNNNSFFNCGSQDTIQRSSFSQRCLAPVDIHPEIIPELRKYIYLPRDVS